MTKHCIVITTNQMRDLRIIEDEYSAPEIAAWKETNPKGWYCYEGAPVLILGTGRLMVSVEQGLKDLLDKHGFEYAPYTAEDDAALFKRARGDKQ